MTTTWQLRPLPGLRVEELPVLISRLLTRRRVIDQMRTSSATCR